MPRTPEGRVALLPLEDDVLALANCVQPEVWALVRNELGDVLALDAMTAAAMPPQEHLEQQGGPGWAETSLRRTRLLGKDRTPIIPSLTLARLLLSLDSGGNRKIDTQGDSAV